MGSAVTASEADFLCDMVAEEDLGSWELGVRVEIGIIRRFFARLSIEEVDVSSGLEALFTSFDDREVLDLLPMPFRRALNFRLVAFMAGKD